MTDEPRTATIPERVKASAETLWTGAETDRTVFFSDAVYAIAMTLLVLDLKLPDTAAHLGRGAFDEALVEKIPAFIAFVLSFMLLGRSWIQHHRRFTAITRYDPGLQSLNLVQLFFVAFMPVPTSLLFESGAASPWPPVIYAVTMAAINIVPFLLWRHARLNGLLADSVSPALFRYLQLSPLHVAVVFLLSIPVAFVDASAAMYFWILILPVSLVWGRLQHRRFVRAETARFEAAASGEAGATAAGAAAAG